ncbi:MAG: phosphoserine phosphatase SerB [Algisphaera sp.]
MRFTGEDRPGLTAELSTALARQGAVVLDLNQAVIHDSLLLGVMVRFSGEAALEAIEAVASELGLSLKVRPVADEAYDHWCAQEGKPRHLLTLLTRTVTAAQLAAVTREIAAQDLNIDVIHRLSGRPPRVEGSAPRRACVEFWLRGKPRDAEAMHATFMQIGADHAVDLAWQKDDAYRRSRRMVVFDMDSTLIQAEVIDELAKEAGAGEKVSAITEAAMRGELDFDDSLRQRVASLAGLPESVLAKVADRLILTEGAQTLMANLRAFGYKTAVLSGGFDYFGRFLQQKLGLDHVHANTLEIEGGKLTGRVTGTIVNGPRKAELLKQMAAEEGIHPRQVIAVGDGANDLPMLNCAGLGIAFHAKPKVREEAEHAVSTLGLDAVLYLLGVRDRERAEMPDAKLPNRQADKETT